jgi:5-methylcytosine-specific restriction protein B
MTPSSQAPTSYGAATDAKILEVVQACLRYGGSSIVALAGVPGTGKSYVGRIAAQRVAGDPLRVRELQFHPSTTYEEFVEGLRIDASGAIVKEPGLFLEWNDLANDNPDLTWVLLIEELSRANVSAVLGELLTFVEDRTRAFTSIYSRRPIMVAPNLVFLATYNPTDRSALDIDNALLRRLRIINFPPDTGQLEEMLAAKLNANALSRLVRLFSEVEIAHRIDYEYLMPFGHGIFAEVQHEQPDLNELWFERIRHMLRRPLVQPHPFAKSIEAVYPWTDASYNEPNVP